MRILLLCLLVGASFGIFSSAAHAVNIGQFADLISDSGPGALANHTLKFTPKVPIGPNAFFQVDFPSDFVMVQATSTFGARNVELYVNGVRRVASTTVSTGIDRVDLTGGAGGSIRYTLAPDASIGANSNLELRIGNHTSVALGPRQVFSTTTGTSTVPADVLPVRNPNTLGVHEIALSIIDGVEIADTNFVVFINRKVTVSGDTTEEIPPERFNGSPTSTVAGTSLNVEISLETNEFAICRFDTASGTPYALQPNFFSNTGLVVHTTVVPVTPNSLAQFFIRCIDDEGNFNIDDYEISFTVSAEPTGTSNTTGSTSGDGTGSGNDGTGSGEGAGGTVGGSDGDTNESGNQTGGGGSGGGGGGGGGGGRGSGGGGGFENSDGPFESGDAQVIISGHAFPGAQVTIMADGQIVDRVRANGQGEYSTTVDEIARGAYTFAIYAEDRNGERTGTFSTSFTVSGARASRLSNINITPTIAVSPDPAEPGETLTFSGFTLPDANVTIETGRTGGANTVTLTATSDGSGFYTTSLETQGFARDTYQVRARAEQPAGDGERTNFSAFEFYGLGQTAEQPLFADLNRDGSVNLIDFSILLFWWQSSGGDSDPPADINQDGTVSLTDFSILLFNWTG